MKPSTAYLISGGILFAVGVLLNVNMSSGMVYFSTAFILIEMEEWEKLK